METKISQIGWIYVLHFERKLKHSQHYVGCTADPEARLLRHSQGCGARIVEAALEAGIGFRLGALGLVADRFEMRLLERRLKNWHGAEEQCEACHPEGARAIPGTTPYPVGLLKWRAAFPGFALQPVFPECEKEGGS